MSNHHVFDPQAALERLDGDSELLATLVSVYFEDSEVLMEQLSKGLSSGDLPGAQRAAHSLKGLAANFNAIYATEAAFTLEKLAREGDADRMVRELSVLQSCLAELREALERWYGAQERAAG